ncbi:MAG: ABC transporter substrate-binding protein [Thermoguttaceae bacterium]
MRDLSDNHALPAPDGLPSAGLPLLVGWFALLACAGVGWGQTPIYEQRPFDRITLDEANDNLVLNVLPLDKQFPDRKLPEKLPTTGKLIVEPVNEPGTQYECLWRNVVKVELFEQLILNEVNGLVRAGRFEDAYQYFVQLENQKPDLAGLREAFDNYLFEEAKAMQTAGQYDGALARLRELHQRTPTWPRLEQALTGATAKLVEKTVNERQYWIARSYLDQLAAAYPENPVIVTWRDHLQKLAEKELADARAAIDLKRLREANEHVRQAAAIWPVLPGLEEVRGILALDYPRYVVAVGAPATVHQPGRINDWASRRSGRLVERTLLEFVGAGTEGGKYICPVGEMSSEDLGRQLEFQLRADIAVSGRESVLTGYDLSRQFLEMADPAGPQYRQQWGGLFESVSVRDVFTAIVRLRRPFVLPQALLQTPISGPTASPDGVEAAGGTIGPYRAESSQGAEAIFLTNTSYFGGEASRPKEIVERHYDSGGDMLSDLRRGEVDVVDRVNLWELDRYRALAGVEVKPYAAPLVHCLIPNPKRPLSSRRAFRRALVYGINREAILKLLVNSAAIPGCRVISGPFSAGVRPDDPLGYAYDKSLEPRSYEPHLAVALAEVAFNEYVEIEKKKEQTVKAVPETVLAHPGTELARLAAQQIQRQLKILGIQVTLKELGPDVPARIPDDVDLLYAELAMWEPVVDAERLLGDDGIMGEASPYMRQALLHLRQSVDWPTVGRQLREIHELTHSEASIIPLWQLTDYFAHVSDLEGLGDSPVTLYQYVEEWRARSQSAPKKP